MIGHTKYRIISDTAELDIGDVRVVKVDSLRFRIEKNDPERNRNETRDLGLARYVNLYQ